MLEWWWLILPFIVQQFVYEITECLAPFDTVVVISRSYRGSRKGIQPGSPSLIGLFCFDLVCRCYGTSHFAIQFFQIFILILCCFYLWFSNSGVYFKCPKHRNSQATEIVTEHRREESPTYLQLETNVWTISKCKFGLCRSKCRL